MKNDRYILENLKKDFWPHCALSGLRRVVRGTETLESDRWGQTNVKGQLISECPFDAWKFSKIPPKNLIDFCPGRLYRLGMLVWVNMYCI